jgi:hypothetical protein
MSCVRKKNKEEVKHNNTSYTLFLLEKGEEEGAGGGNKILKY